MTTNEMETPSSAEQASQEPDDGHLTIQGDQPPQVFRPWRRYWARSLDLFLYNILWSGILALFFHVILATRSSLANLLDTFAAFALMLVLEPLWLHFFRTTPGKAILGLRVETPEGRPLSYREGLARTWGVIGRGMGYNLPIYSLVRLWKSYKLCKENEPQPWDASISYTIRDTRRVRGWIYVGVHACGLIILFMIMFAQRMPPHRGDLTVTQFSDNYRYYAHLYNIEPVAQHLGANGKWVKKEFDETATIGTTYTEQPDFTFDLKDGHVTGVSFAVDIKDNHDPLGSYDIPMSLAALALAGAQREVGLFSNIPDTIDQQITSNAFHGFRFTEAGITFTCDTEYSGYQSIDMGPILFPDETAASNSFQLSFSARK